MKRASYALLAALLATAPAQAHFEYTRWGMTEQQVIAASRGAARVLPAPERRSAGAIEYRVTASQRTDAGPSFTVAFGFASPGGLRCISYRADGDGAGIALRAWLIRRYGQPTARGGRTEQGEESLAWTRPDQIDAEFGPRGALALQCQGD
ncbi:hypothetical protein GXW71_18190 [Roseomonas hellenica]|uniref:Lipoprotein n=1 Tax=Plastoroseomonas hellenica TaxID=2687306 RepID=A0ABS5F170_9PROT|nr:hypothetical protein [Plastoroseomonas hellenica]MBR0666297.1 hypothetical protein [Plastoroseomonas hellenica]